MPLWIEDHIRVHVTEDMPIDKVGQVLITGLYEAVFRFHEGKFQELTFESVLCDGGLVPSQSYQWIPQWKDVPTAPQGQGEQCDARG